MSPTTPEVDGGVLDGLREKYRHERDKRLTADRDELLDLGGDLARYVEDPHSSRMEREPLSDFSEVLVVGAGFGGLMIGAELKKRGITDVRLLDTAGDVGGVWYWNRYPGARCDIDALVYLPYVEETKHVPTEKYARQSEIYEHAQIIARTFDLYDRAIFQTSVTGAEWDAVAQEWNVSTDRGDRLRARVLILANGPLQKVKLPAIKGIETFAGHSFHTSRWDYEYTGGDSESDLTRLHGKSVGIIGTGATSLQCIAPLAVSSGHLSVFQRTPSTVAERNNKPIDVDWVASLESGWQKKRRENFTQILFGELPEEDLVDDGWTEIFRELVNGTAHRDLPPEELKALREDLDFQRMERLRGRIAEVVKDPATAEALKPYYAYLCKRPGFHDEYLAAFNRPNVTLVDTQGRGIDEIRPDGAVVDGRLIELDCLIFATGFESETAYTQRIGFDVTGENGTTLSAKWARGVRTLHGMTTAGFPNLLVQPGLGAQSTETPNLVHTMHENAEHMAYIVSEATTRGARTFSLTEAAEQEWVDTIVRLAPDDSEFLAACTPGRKNIEGRPQDRPVADRNYGKGPLEMYRELAAWRATGELPGLALAPAEAADADAVRP